jgi:hypothetical protein
VRCAKVIGVPTALRTTLFDRVGAPVQSEDKTGIFLAR